MAPRNPHRGNPTRATRPVVTIVRCFDGETCETPWSWDVTLDGKVHEQRIATRAQARAKAKELRASLRALWAIGTDPAEVAALDEAQRICEAREVAADAVCLEEVRRHGRCVHCEVMS